MRAVDVAVIGGGVIGAACARAAALRGLTVGIFEPGPDPAAASPASAGLLAAQIEPLDNGLVALAVRSRDQYQRLAAELRDTTGIDIGFWAGGIAAIALDDEEADHLKDAVARQRQAGLRCDWLAADDVHERWPRRPLAGWAAGDSLPRPLLRARPRWRRAARQHHGARGLRQPGHERGARADLPGRRLLAAAPRNPARRADVGGPLPRDAGRPAHPRARSGGPAALVRHRPRPQRRAAGVAHGRDHRRPPGPRRNRRGHRPLARG